MTHMTHARMLLLDYDPTGSLCAPLLEMLAASFTLRRETCAGLSAEAADARARAAFADFAPDLVLPILSAASSARPEEVLGALGALRPTPFVFVVERCEPDEMFALFK